MQTFLPYADFELTFKVLDQKRLCKQRVETLQILQTLIKVKQNKNNNQYIPWSHHPAVLQWEGFEEALGLYGIINCNRWTELGFQDSCLPQIVCILKENNFNLLDSPPLPDFIGNDLFHASHRSKLLQKDPEYYSQFNWLEDTNMDYVWPKRWKK